MKGSIFNIFQSMIEKNHGISLWDKMVKDTKPKSEGAYTSAKTYPDEEMVEYLGWYSKFVQKPIDSLLKFFGHYLFEKLAKAHPHYVENQNLFSFLKSIETKIHVEVKKLDDKANPPRIDVIYEQEDHLIIHYQSKRKLCALAHGLLEASGKYFKENVQITHHECCKKGGEKCLFRIQKPLC